MWLRLAYDNYVYIIYFNVASNKSIALTFIAIRIVFIVTNNNFTLLICVVFDPPCLICMNVVIEIPQGICGNPWPMLDTTARALGHYEDTPINKCAKDGLSRDPENCSGFYSCVNGDIFDKTHVNAILRKSQKIKLYHLKVCTYYYYYFFF